MAEFSQRELNEELSDNNMMGQWQVLKSGEGKEKIRPHVWDWEAIEEALYASLDTVDLDEEPQGARRAVGLKNPIFGDDRNWTTRTISAGIQIVEPGELAKAHRHNMTALRFVIDGGSDVVTVVEGEEFPMEDGDLVLTPADTWHDHVNDSDEAAIWLDGLDAPLWKGINAMELEVHSDVRQPVDKPRGYNANAHGVVRPTATSEDVDLAGGAPPFRYAWEDAYEALQVARENGRSADPHDGTVVSYVNPASGEPPALPSIDLRLQLIEPGEETESHMHISSEFYLVVEGSGETVVDDETLEWGENDCFVVPSDSWHHHRNTGEDDAILFAMSDAPLFESFSIYHEESKTEAEGVVQAGSESPTEVEGTT